MQNSPIVDTEDPDLQFRVRRAASRAASQAGLQREVDDIAQEIWVALLSIDPSTPPEKVAAACSSVALYRRAIDYTRTLDGLSRQWRSTLIDAATHDYPTQTIAEVMGEIGVPARMRRHEQEVPSDASAMDNVDSGDSDFTERVVMRDAISRAIAEITAEKMDDLDRAIVNDYLLSKSSVLAELAIKHGVTESAASLRLKKMRERLQKSLAKQGITKDDVR